MLELKAVHKSFGGLAAIWNVSLRIEEDQKIKYIQVQLGHSSPTVTLNVYAHLMKPTNQAAACRPENAVFGESGSKMVAEMKKGPRP